MKTLGVLISIGAVYAFVGPPMKEGLWTIHTQTTDQSGKKEERTSSICRNHEYDDRVRTPVKTQGCKTNESFAGGKLTVESECTVQNMVIRTKGTSTFNGDSSTHSEMHTTYTPPMSGMSETTMIMDQKYVGACPAGMEPGDTMAADGKVIHRGKK